MANKIDPIYAVVGAAIRDRRNQLGLTQEELGIKVGLTRTSITNIEAGRQQILFHTIRDLAGAMGLPVAALLNGACSDDGYLQTCSVCAGAGCEKCDHTGEVPTAEGEKILALFKHSLAGKQ